MELTAENTAIVVDSTADFPEAPERFPNWRVVPLYVRFGDESFRDYVELAPERVLRSGCAPSPELPTTSQPTPGDFLAAYEELAGYERILSLHISGKLSGTFESARTAAARARRRARALDRHGDRLGGDRDARARDPAPARARARPTRRSTRSSSASAREARLLFTVDTLEYLARGGRIGRAARMGGRAAAHQADPLDRGRRGRCRSSACAGNQKAFVEFASAFEAGTRRRAEPARRDRPRRRAGEGRGAAHAGARRAADGARSSVVTTLGAVVGTHAGPGNGRLLLVHDDA